MSDKIKVLVVEPMQPCRAQEIPDTLEAMQALVGGGIEAVTSLRNASAIVCNDMGKLQGLPCNRPLLDESGLVPLDILHGTFFIAGVSGEHFVSLTEEQIQRYKALYDNVMVVTAERPAAQAEIAPEATMSDYNLSNIAAVSASAELAHIRANQEPNQDSYNAAWLHGYADALTKAAESLEPQRKLMEAIIGYMGERYDSAELYGILHDTLEMSDQEIRSLGFDLPQCKEPLQAHQGTKSAKRKGIYHER